MTLSEEEEEYASSDSDFDNESEDSQEDIEELTTESDPKPGVEDSAQDGKVGSGGEHDNSIDNNESDSRDDLTNPEVLLTKLLRVNIDADFDVAKTTKIKCLALCKIVFGERHWKVAEAHVQLANVYLKGKHYPQQVLKHTKIARDILLSATKTNSHSEESEREYLLQNLYYLMGRVNYQLSQYNVSQNHLMKAKLVSEHTKNATSKFLKMKINILSSLADTLSKIKQLGQAIEYLEEAIEVADKMSGADRYLSINLYKQIVSIELLNGKHANISFAMETALKAQGLSSSFNGKNSKETAEIYLLCSRVEILKDVADFEKIEGYLQDALDIYTTFEDNRKIIQTEEMMCKILMKQEKLPAAKLVLKKAITMTENTFGDMSLQSADLYELMGNILFAENKMSNALTYFLKAQETYKGKQRYQSRQVKISKLIDIIRKSSEQKIKEKPHFNY